MHSCKNHQRFSSPVSLALNFFPSLTRPSLMRKRTILLSLRASRLVRARSSLSSLALELTLQFVDDLQLRFAARSASLSFSSCSSCRLSCNRAARSASLSFSSRTSCRFAFRRTAGRLHFLHSLSAFVPGADCLADERSGPLQSVGVFPSPFRYIFGSPRPTGSRP